jgi:hypothetical protein|tara:strand:- start:3884 stop:4408 length:525 start_codon:yes stop_codon:yes gene_type:complete
MGGNQPERRQNDRRKNPGGAPPPGTVVDRRLGLDQRAQPKRDMVTGLERARGAGRRLSDFTKAAEEGEMTTEQFLFLMAIDAFKKSNDRMFPTWTDVLEVIRLLGYRKTMASDLNLPNADDWRERPDAPANVRPQRWAERFHKSERQLADDAIAEFEAQFDGKFEDEDDLENAA